AFVAEALERGWLTAADVGVPFGWGEWRGMLRLVEMTARREGFGDRLAEGAWRLAESVHPEGTRLVYAVKRLELPAHSARALKGLSIGYATATRGGSHHDTRPTPQYAPTFDRRSTADVLLGEPAALQRLAHEGERDAHGDRVQAEQIAEVVGQDERLGLGDAQHRAQREDRLVLRHLGPGPGE